MRHGKKHNHLGRTSNHRKALLSNMASSLIIEKRISTTLAKAKELRKYVEPLLTKAKTDSTHSRRIVFSYLQNKDSMKALFGDVAAKIANRPGGYTRILKTGTRLGDNSSMCIIELVDYNDTYGKEGKSAAKGRTRRSKGGSKEKGVEDAVVVDDKKTTEVKAETKAKPEAKADSKAKSGDESKTSDKKEAKGKKKE
jgi:large subunit ribosomal protein L17